MARPLSEPDSAPASRWTSAPALLGLLALWLLATSGWRPLLLPDEGRYAEVARAMWQSGDWLVPTLDGLPFFHKPPLFYWLDLGALQGFGATEFAGRFGSVVGAWLMGASVFLAMRRWHGRRTAQIALGLLATTPFFFVGGQYANHDMLVGGLITAAVLALARAVESPTGRPLGDSHPLGGGPSPGGGPRGRHSSAPAVDLRWLVAGWVLCALATLAKGLIGFVLPALVIGPWLLAQGRWRQMFRLLHPLGLAAFAVVGLPWFVAMQRRFPEFFDYFVIEQHFRRFAGTEFNNVHGVWFFFAVMPLLTLPWSLWLPAAWRQAWRERDARIGLYAWWVIAVVGFFSIPSSKLVGYALPAVAPWCALLALPIAAAASRRWRVVMGATALALLAVVVAASLKSPGSNRALGLTLRAQIGPGERVAMLGDYVYDVPFYARLTQPVVVFGDWDDPDIARHDNWRKELADAARFDPAAARDVLRPLAGIDTFACGLPAAWFVLPAGHAGRVAAQAGAARVFADGRNELWRVPGHRCAP